jgi:hypothetical protein
MIPTAGESRRRAAKCAHAAVRTAASGKNRVDTPLIPSRAVTSCGTERLKMTRSPVTTAAVNHNHLAPRARTSHVAPKPAHAPQIIAANMMIRDPPNA